MTSREETQPLEAIILAGGLGTRLREAVPDLPKCLAEVAGRPILSYIIDHLRINGIRRFIFSLGYKSEMIVDYLEREYPTLDKVTVIEEEPLGTGGAVRLSLQKAITNHPLVVNGDTLFQADLHPLAVIAENKHAECVVALKPMRSFDRYGSVSLNSEGMITAFREKQFCEEGLINAGIYLLDKQAFLNKGLSGKFSFEKDYLEKYTAAGKFFGSVQDAYFIDIGIPEDLHKAGNDLRRPQPSLSDIDKSWSVFLDRDGVINNELVGRYVLNWSEFHFLPGAEDAVVALRDIFGKIFIVSNQRGVGKGLMTEDDLLAIHKEMQNIIEQKGGKIDDIFYCTDVENTCFDRKPNPGMAVQALRKHPGISLKRSVMVGNKPTDMRFGRSAGMVNVFITSTNPDQPFPHPDIDFIFPSLSAFVEAMKH